MFTILFTALALFSAETPLPESTTDTSIAAQCVTIGLDSAMVTAAFQTLDAILAAEQIFFLDSQKYFLCADVDAPVPVQTLAQRLKFNFPSGGMTAPGYYATIYYRESDLYRGNNSPILNINVYNSTADNNLPIARLTYAIVTGTRYYEYITTKGNVEYTIE